MIGQIVLSSLVAISSIFLSTFNHRPNVKTLPRMVNNHHGAPFLSGLGDHHIEILHLTGRVFISDIHQVTQVIQNHYGVTVVCCVSLDPIQEIQLMPIEIKAEEVFYGIGL